MYHKKPWYRDPDLFNNIALICTITILIGAYLVFVFGIAFSTIATLPGKIIAISGMTLMMVLWGTSVFANYLKGHYS